MKRRPNKIREVRGDVLELAKRFKKKKDTSNNIEPNLDGSFCIHDLYDLLEHHKNPNAINPWTNISAALRQLCETGQIVRLNHGKKWPCKSWATAHDLYRYVPLGKEVPLKPKEYTIEADEPKDILTNPIEEVKTQTKEITQKLNGRLKLTLLVGDAVNTWFDKRTTMSKEDFHIVVDMCANIYKLEKQIGGE